MTNTCQFLPTNGSFPEDFFLQMSLLLRTSFVGAVDSDERDSSRSFFV